MSTMIDKTAVDEIAALAQKGMTEIVTLTAPEGMKGVPSAIPVVLDKAKGTALNIAPLFENYRTHPQFAIGQAEVTTLESFVDLVDRHKTPDSVIFGDADWKEPSLTAVIDYHQVDHSPEFLRHKIQYDFPLSEEWKLWLGINGKPMDQTSFAEFIEDHIAECSSPGSDEEEEYRTLFNTKVAYPNELMVLSRGLSVLAEVRVKNAVTLQTGEGQITFDETHKDAATGNAISVPGIFILAIAPFFLGDFARIPVRLRYRVRDGKIYWTMHMFRPDKHITEQIRRDMTRAASETGLPLFLGSPEA